MQQTYKTNLLPLRIFYPFKFMNSMSYKYGLWNGYGKRITKIKDSGYMRGVLTILLWQSERDEIKKR